MIHPETVTKLLFPIDTRLRYKPELPPARLLRQRGGVPTSSYEGKDVGIGTVTVRGGVDIGGEEGRVVGDEYRMSVLDSIEGNGRRAFCRESALVVSDMSRLRFAEVDFGWGPAVYGGPARAGTGHVPGMLREELRGCWLWFPPCLHRGQERDFRL
ncbi:hypothetical protein Syun_024029 [Stephania yunnanensis]|uniref:Uncharacterized protein n=1 Tax=Stephania yunnanensis TaxID=152371 RepID=A0AAP0FJ01_9MAGN